MADIVRLQSGEKVDQWTVIGKVGEGGFGSVYKVVIAIISIPLHSLIHF